MKFTKEQRDGLPLCVMGRSNHAWKLGSKIFEESGICGKCGYDAFDNLHRNLPNEVDDA